MKMAKILHQYNFHNLIFTTFNERPPGDQFSTTQTHSTDMIALSDLKTSSASIEGDGIFGKISDIAASSIAIKTADCQPILLLNESDFVFIHAGWRGLADGILEKTAHNITSPLHIYIGPCIHSQAFEVSYDFKDNFQETEHFFKVDDKYFFDLVGFTIQTLKKLYPNAQIQDSGICTFQNTQYNSYRRDKTQNRNWNIISQK